MFLSEKKIDERERESGEKKKAGDAEVILPRTRVSFTRPQRIKESISL